MRRIESETKDYLVGMINTINDERLISNNYMDNISDTASESSDMSENFVPRIIRPRR